MRKRFIFYIKNHPFVDGNKRTALASALTFLRINGWYLKMRPNDLYELTIQVAEGHLSKEEIAKIFKEHCGII
ncbi:type II toxin-antitoxin system death-on-curing family toxin [bacterium]|nr:type II toxin-antitoxin system death-on-curing family toxin [bacterium]